MRKTDKVYLTIIVVLDSGVLIIAGLMALGVIV